MLWLAGVGCFNTRRPRLHLNGSLPGCQMFLLHRTRVRDTRRRCWSEVALLGYFAFRQRGL
jgi:hypothetical protein